jgi:H+/Cl- antiporter ClcA
MAIQIRKLRKLIHMLTGYVFFLVVGVVLQLVGHYLSYRFSIESRRRAETRFSTKRKALFFLLAGSISVPLLLWLISLYSAPYDSMEQASTGAVLISFALCVIGYSGLIAGGFLMSAWTAERINAANSINKTLQGQGKES